MELDQEWITNYEKNEEKYRDFYQQKHNSIKVFFLYVNKENTLETINEKTIQMNNLNILTREELIQEIREKMIYNKRKYKLLSLLLYNIDINPKDLVTYLQKEENFNFLKSFKNIETIYLKETISLFSDLTSLFVIFYEYKKKLKNNSTKKIYISNTTKHRKTQRKLFKDRNNN